MIHAVEEGECPDGGTLGSLSSLGGQGQDIAWCVPGQRGGSVGDTGRDEGVEVQRLQGYILPKPAVQMGR